MASHAIILFAHGSRDPLWHRPMEAVADRIRAREAGITVACAYLELSPPDLPACVASLVAAGTLSIRVLPMFLGVGRHAREDLPQIMTTLRTTHPAVAFELLPAVGEDPRLIETLAHIAIS